MVDPVLAAISKAQTFDEAIDALAPALASMDTAKLEELLSRGCDARVEGSGPWYRAGRP